MTTPQLLFKAPSLEHARLLNQLNTTFQPYADTAYGTFLTWWDLYDDLAFAVLNGNIVVRSSYPTLGKTITYSIVGSHMSEKTIGDVFDWQKHHKLETTLHSMPEYHLSGLATCKNISIIPQPDISEYVLSTEQQARLPGADFYMMRHKIKRFERAYSNHNLSWRDIDLAKPKNRKILTDSLALWDAPSKNDHDNTEKTVIQKSLKLHSMIGMRCFGLFADEQLISFGLYKVLPKSYINLNHLKVSPHYKDLFMYTLHTLAIHLQNHAIEYINIEQDLGIEGLRTFKQRLRPVALLDKYTITRV